MSFVLKMAVRETRASWKRLLFFFICISIGVAAIVALRSVIQSVRQVLTSEAQTLIASDVFLSTNRPWSPAATAAIARDLTGAPVLARTESIETATMVRPTDPTKTLAKMVELRAIQPAFPLYGRLVLQSAKPFSHALVAGRGAVVRPELLTELDVKIGDQITIGKHAFTIRDVVTAEPGRRPGAFSLGPRVFIDYADLADSGLLAFGSQAQYQVMLKVRDDAVASLVTRLRQTLQDQFVNVRSYKSTQDSVGDDLSRSENYLSLVGLVIVVLGGIGVSSVTKVFIQQKIKSIAVLKCVGGRTRQILAIYLAQVLLLGLAGSLLGVGLAALAMQLIPGGLEGTSAVTISYALTPAATVQGIGVGLLVSLLFSVAPLLEVRHVKPSILLRQDSQSARSRDWLRIGVIALVSIALVAIASWQASSLRVGLAVSVGFVVLAAVLHLAGRGLVWAIRPLSRSTWFPLRQATLRLSRPGNQTRVVLLAVGLGSFFIVAVQGLERNLLDEFALDLRANSPDMFLIDIQRDQVEPFRAFLRARGIGQPALIPMLRARVVSVKGAAVNLERFEDVRGRGSLGREYGVTYRDHLEANESVLQGRFWTPGSRPAPAEVSIEESLHDRFKIGVGDTMRFDVLGRVITARVSSIRRVEWRDSRNGGFMFVFSPGVFDGAPQMFISPLKGPVDVTARARLQHDMVIEFPNVSVIDVREVLETIQRVLANVTLAISVVGGLVLFSGGLILVGAVAMTKFQRVYEAAIFKTLGASTRTLAGMLVFEYGLLGALAGTIGSLGAAALGWGVCKYALDISWRFLPWLTVAGIAVTATLVAAIGVTSSLDVLRRKPLGTLRAE